MSNKTQLQENNATLEYIIEQLRGMPTTEDCMAAIKELQTKVTPIEQGGTGAITAEEALANLGGAKIQAGSYVGTGKWGKSYPNKLEFEFTPELVFIVTTPHTETTPNGIKNTVIIWFGVTTHYGLNTSSSGQFSVFSYTNNTMEWYAQSGGETFQLNASGTTYKYIAIG